MGLGKVIRTYVLLSNSSSLPTYCLICWPVMFSELRYTSIPTRYRSAGKEMEMEQWRHIDVDYGSGTTTSD